jgi:hypothetical protein
MDILGQFGFNLVVVPHWNNAEGGTHDTRFCFMGEPRFRQLEALLPEDVSILGLDEHTACVMDLAIDRAEIKGIGKVILRRSDGEAVFEAGERFSLDIFRGQEAEGIWKPKTPEVATTAKMPASKQNSFWDKIHSLDSRFRLALEDKNPRQLTNALLELDRTIWQAQQELENEEFITQARDTLRELIVLLGNRLTESPDNKAQQLAPLVNDLLELRQQFRDKGQWQDSDAIRDSLQKIGIRLEDTPTGSRWRLKS